MTDGALHFHYIEGKVATVKPNFTPNFLGPTVACKVATFCTPSKEDKRETCQQQDLEQSTIEEFLM
jgi:hypothetical protein